MNGLGSTAARAKEVARYLRLQPFDTTTEEGRAAERYRRIAWSTVAGMAARGISLGVTLFTIPLALGYLGPEQFGIWITVSAITALLAFTDFGLGNGLMNLVANAYGQGDRLAAQRAISSAFFILLALAAVGTVVFMLVYPLLPWATIVNAESASARAEAGPAVAAFFVCLAASLPLNLVQRVQYGYQEAYEVSLWSAVGSVASLAGLVLAIQLNAALPWLVLALAGGPVVAAAANTLYVFGRRHPELMPRMRLARGRVGLKLVRVGLLYFWLQLALAIAYQSDVVVAAQILGPAAAAEYAVVLKLFFVVPNLMWMGFLPLWPAYGEAVARGDLRWLRRTLVRTTIAAVLVAASSSAILLLVGREVLHVWVGSVFDPPLILLVGMALWAVMSTAFGSIAMFLNGAGVVRFQAIVATVMAAASITGSLYLATKMGLSGVIWGTIVAYVVFAGVPTLWYVPRVFGQLQRRSVVN